MFESPISAAIAALSYPEERRRYYARLGMISGIGTTVGTQIGAFLIGYDFKQVCLGGAAFFFVAALAISLALPPVAASVGSASASAGIRQVLTGTLFLRYVVIVAGYWFAWTQFGLTITLAAVDITGSDRAVSWIYLVNAIVTIALGYVLPRFLERWLPPLQLQIAGVATIGLGLMAVGLASGFNGVLIAVAIFAIGAVMARPGQETVMANLAHPSARGTYFGIASIALAVGGGLGNYLGGVIYDAGGGAESPVPWLIFGGVALTTSALLWFNRNRFSVVRS
ncbi:MAG: MFS transporter [Thermomicrobiales bacterium]|nr:MFS transporter [Thermomicrobiales bacterium]